MRHFASRRFWQCFDTLPAEIRSLAVRSYALLKRNPAHPSLQFKPIHAVRLRSVRIGLYYRALGTPVVDGIQWFWIGSHTDYDLLIR